MARTREDWIAIAKKRIGSILATYRISYSRHLEIKISEAGPSHMRVEPVLVNIALSQLIRDKVISVVHSGKNEPKIVGASDFGRPGDKARLKAFVEWHHLFVKKSNDDPLCGLVLEYFISNAVQNSKDYWILGGGPEVNEEGKLFKPKGSETTIFDNKKIYKSEDGAGFDLFLLHKEHQIPIGIEAKNIREWIYPASLEVWRMIARACTLECLPVLVARKISYITIAGLFSQFGILGFQTQFQYFHQNVQRETKYQFKDKIINKDKLGFADIKLVKTNGDVPKHFNTFFNKTLPGNTVQYFEKFMDNRDLLMKYAINYGMAETKLSGKERYELYEEFKEEATWSDPEFEG